MKHPQLLTLGRVLIYPMTLGRVTFRLLTLGRAPHLSAAPLLMLHVPPVLPNHDHLPLLLNVSSGTSGSDIKPISICTLLAPNTRSCPHSLLSIVQVACLLMSLTILLWILQHTLILEMVTRQMKTILLQMLQHTLILVMMTHQLKTP
jgi:hypothetical protein